MTNNYLGFLRGRSLATGNLDKVVDRPALEVVMAPMLTLSAPLTAPERGRQVGYFASNVPRDSFAALPTFSSSTALNS